MIDDPLVVRTARSWRGIVAFTHLAREGRMTVTIGRRELLAALGGGAVAWLAGIPCYCGREPHDDLRGSP